MSTFQFSQFFQKSLMHLGTPLHVFRFLTHFLYFLFLASATQFILNGFYLLLQEIFTLLLVNIFTSTHLDRCFNFGQLYLAVQNFK